jgi:hypothetical protein
VPRRASGNLDSRNKGVVIKKFVRLEVFHASPLPGAVGGMIAVNVPLVFIEELGRVP